MYAIRLAAVAVVVAVFWKSKHETVATSVATHPFLSATLQLQLQLPAPSAPLRPEKRANGKYPFKMADSRVAVWHFCLLAEKKKKISK